ncbi:MFS transporter [Roseiarcaceae bacterium H3SJ34-1]|uniref:MFS transporter n=1 Tax=Terripilifer ovatus TaxID=3032367 RepID=UPI003AB989B5|nr:MFS transporter [Roseiarcaceae bacterium H3SJ34-1]
MAVLARFSDLTKVLRDRNYRLYLAGNFASSIGIWVQKVAIGWMAWELTKSPAWLGIISLAETGPTIALGLYSGALLDRLDHMRVLRATQALTLLYATALAVLTLTGLMNIWLLTVLVLSRGTIFSINRPARQTVVYDLVGRAFLPSALAMNSTVINSSKFIGPAIGGFCIVWIGSGGTFVVSLLLLLVFTASLSLMKVTPHERPARAPASIGRDMLDGLIYVVTHKGVRLQLGLLIALALFAKPVTDLLPGFVSDIFKHDARGLATLLGCHGLGAMAGGLWLSARNTLRGLVTIAVCSICFTAAALIVFSLTTTFWLACLLIALLGFLFVATDISSQTLIQTGIRTRYRGRTMSIYGMVAQGMPSVGSMLMGFSAEYLGLQTPILIGGILCFAIASAAWLFRRAMIDNLELVRTQSGAEP